jgi:hypothetical protein
MRPSVLLCFLFLAVSAQARLGETVQEIENRYGKPLKGVKAETPASVAGVYEKNGFRIIVGFYQNKSYYEQISKIDPEKPSSCLEISEAARGSLLQLNCKGCSWKGHAQETFSPDGRSYYVTTYKPSSELVAAVYDGDKKVFTIRLLVVEKQNEADEQKRERENLKGF